MLKDLEQRNSAEQENASSTPLPLPIKKNNNKAILLLLVSIVSFSVIGLFIWQLYNQNLLLKQDVGRRLANSQTLTSAQNQSQNANQTITQEEISPRKLVVVRNVDTNEIVISQPREQLNNSKSAKTTPQPQGIKNTNKPTSSANSDIIGNSTGITVAKNTLGQHSRIEKVEVESPIDKNQQQVKPFAADKAESQDKAQPSASMEVTRTQLSANELAKQKMVQAKQAIENNKLEQAEHLFEDILLLLPKNKEARKQLAALWYGRQAFQDALNLLSQGIIFDNLDSEYRLMKARIYLSQDNNEQAYQSLQPLADVKNVEYQLTLANVAQQLGKFEAGIYAYKVLLNMQANNGRWWLGLAVIYDQNSQFERAQQAYNNALKQNDLSDSAMAFTKQRLQALAN